MSEDNLKPPPKKRGRKPKQPVVENENVVISLGINNNTDEQTGNSGTGDKPAPKKRGRKPKGGKIVEPEKSNTDEQDQKMNIILHLKCSLKDLQTSQHDYMEPYNGNINSQFEPIGNEAEQMNDYGSTYNVIDNNKQQIVAPVKSENEQDNIVDTDENETKVIWKKLKQLEKNLNHNHTDHFKADCFWCTCSFDNPPCFIPKCYLKETYNVYGCFCSPECACAYLMNENIDSSTKFERYYLLNHIYAEVYKYIKNIKPAPSPFYTLNKYYGNMTIQEYRALLSDERLFLIVDKPMTRIMPELHQTNDDHILSNKIIPTNQSGRKVMKPTTKNDALVENFGLGNKQ